MKSSDINKSFADKYIYPFLYHNDDRKYLNTKRFSPVIYDNDLPAEGDLFHYNWKDVPYKSEKDRHDFIRDNRIIIDKAWWKDQRNKCLNGVIFKDATNLGEDIWIPGRMYFFLNFWPIKRAGDIDPRKQLLNPKFLDVTFEKFFLVRELSIYEKKNNMWQKRRQIGWTENSASDVGFEFTFFPDSQSVVVAGEEKYTFNFMNFVTRGLKYLSNTPFHIQVDKYRPTEYISAKYRNAEIYGRTALNNAEAVSSLSPSLIYFEESGIWQEGLLQKAYDKVDASLTAESDENGEVKKTGYGYVLGTGGLAEAGVATAQKMFYNPRGNGFLEFDNIYEEGMAQDKVACFVPAYYFKIIDKDGNSDKKASEKAIYEERESKSLEARYTRITEFPLKPSESFMSSLDGFFGREIIQMLNERKAFLMGNKDFIKQKRGYLKWNNSSNWHEGVDFVESDEEDWCIINEPPERDAEGKPIPFIYKAGTDSYDQDESYTSTSQGSIQVYKTFRSMESSYNKYVARITERPKEGEGGATRFFEWALMLCVYYAAINLVEDSKKLIVHYFVEKNFDFLLKPKPDFFLSMYVNDSKSQTKYGIEPSTKTIWLKKLREYMTIDNINKVDDIGLLEAWSKFKYKPGDKYNCDITISSSLCQVLAFDDANKDIEQEEETDERYGSAFIEKDGMLQQIMV